MRNSRAWWNSNQIMEEMGGGWAGANYYENE